MSHYQKPPELYAGLRLHQNENTGGCSPRVLAALAALRADQIGFYPPYAAATDAVAHYLGVPVDRVTLHATRVAAEPVDVWLEDERRLLVGAALVGRPVEAAGLPADHVQAQTGGDGEDGDGLRGRVWHGLFILD